MGIVGIIAGVVGIIEALAKKGLLKEARKYIDEIKSLQETYLLEDQKPLHLQNDAIYADVVARMHIVLAAAASDIANAGIKS